MSTSKRLSKILLRVYLLADLISGAAAYTALHIVRKVVVEPSRFGKDLEIKWDPTFWLALTATALIYICISALSGIYRDLTRTSRLQQAFNTMGGVILTSIALFFLIFLDDFVSDYSQYYLTLGTYSFTLLMMSGIFRFSLSSHVRARIDRKTLTFKSILIGTGKEAGDLYESFQRDRNKGYEFVGVITINGEEIDPRLRLLNHLGTVTQLKDVVNDNEIEDVIIALGAGFNDQITRLVSEVEHQDLRIHVLPNLFSILTGQVKMESFGRSLIEIKRELIKPHVAFIKRVFDLLVAFMLMFTTSPLLLFSILMVRIGSKGSIFYTQERLGKHGRPFQIIKLRSMFENAEKLGPQLSSEEDPRITSWGRTMRKYRLDELPQFINVLKGDMSIVGPRPERRFFFDQITTQAPQYKYLLKVKPGITSWGMVKFGYAENVDEMLERARYDLIYTENITLINDIKILFYTLVIVLEGRGK